MLLWNRSDKPLSVLLSIVGHFVHRLRPTATCEMLPFSSDQLGVDPTMVAEPSKKSMNLS